MIIAQKEKPIAVLHGAVALREFNKRRKRLKMDIRVGQIWIIVKRLFFVSKEVDCICSCGNKHTHMKIIELPRNMPIEIRFPFEWHFRTEENEYFHNTPEEIHDKCIFLGTIDEEIRFNNKHKLKEILELNLYKI